MDIAVQQMSDYTDSHWQKRLPADCLLHLLPLVDSARGRKTSGFFLGVPSVAAKHLAHVSSRARQDGDPGDRDDRPEERSEKRKAECKEGQGHTSVDAAVSRRLSSK